MSTGNERWMRTSGTDTVVPNSPESVDTTGNVGSSLDDVFDSISHTEDMVGEESQQVLVMAFTGQQRGIEDLIYKPKASLTGVSDYETFSSAVSKTLQDNFDSEYSHHLFVPPQETSGTASTENFSGTATGTKSWEEADMSNDMSAKNKLLKWGLVIGQGIFAIIALISGVLPMLNIGPTTSQIAAYSLPIWIAILFALVLIEWSQAKADKV